MRWWIAAVQAALQLMLVILMHLSAYYTMVLLLAKRHVGKKLIVPVFEGTAALRQPCYFDESCECGGDRQSFEKKWLGEDEETAEMAALVPEWFRIEMSNKNENADLFAHVAYWQEGPKATPLEEEKWWWSY